MLPPWVADPAGFIALAEQWAAEDGEVSVSPQPEDDRGTGEEPGQ